MILSNFYSEDRDTGKITKFGYEDDKLGKKEYQKSPYNNQWREVYSDKPVSYEEVEKEFNSLYKGTYDNEVCDSLREQNYKDWIHDQLYRHFDYDEHGGFVHNVDYYEDVPLDIVHRSILEARNYGEFIENLFDELYLYSSDEDAFLDIEENIRKQHIEERYGDLPCYIRNDTDWKEHGYNGIKVDFEGGLYRHFKLNMFITLDNQNENDIKDTFGEYGDIPKGLKSPTETPDILSHLIHSQGETVHDVLKKKLDHFEYTDNEFVNDLAEDLNHTKLEGMQLAVCSNLPFDVGIRDLFDYKDHELYIPQDSYVCLYNPEIGEGGKNWYKLKHGMEMPLNAKVTYQFEDGPTFVRTEDGFEEIELFKGEESNKTLGGRIDLPNDAWDKHLANWNTHGAEAMRNVGYDDVSVSWEGDYIYFANPNDDTFYKFEEPFEIVEWLDSVVFDDPEKSKLVEKTLHPERFIKEIPGCPEIPLSHRTEQLLHDFDTYEYWDSVGMSEEDRSKGLMAVQDLLDDPTAISGWLGNLYEAQQDSSEKVSDYFDAYERETIYLLNSRLHELRKEPVTLHDQIYNCLNIMDQEKFSDDSLNDSHTAYTMIEDAINDPEKAKEFFSSYDIGKYKDKFMNEIEQRAILGGRNKAVIDSELYQTNTRRKKP